MNSIYLFTSIYHCQSWVNKTEEVPALLGVPAGGNRVDARAGDGRIAPGSVGIWRQS